MKPLDGKLSFSFNEICLESAFEVEVFEELSKDLCIEINGDFSNPESEAVYFPKKYISPYGFRGGSFRCDFVTLCKVISNVIEGLCVNKDKNKNENKAASECVINNNFCVSDFVSWFDSPKSSK